MGLTDLIRECCTETETDGLLRDADRIPQALRTLRVPGHAVEIGVSELGDLGLSGGVVCAYHTSVVVDGEEYSFDGTGVWVGQDLVSHRSIPGNLKPRLLDVGLSPHSGPEMLAALNRHFAPGTYDMLRKNCNSFTDSALFFLLEMRLDPRFRGLEKMGAVADAEFRIIRKGIGEFGLVECLSQGGYFANPRADGFSIERTLRQVDAEKRITRAEAEEPSLFEFARPQFSTSPPDLGCCGRGKEEEPSDEPGSALCRCPSDCRQISRTHQGVSQDDISSWGSFC